MLPTILPPLQRRFLQILVALLQLLLLLGTVHIAEGSQFSGMSLDDWEDAVDTLPLPPHLTPHAIPRERIPANLTVAFYSETEVNPQTRRLLRMAKQGADLVVHAGGFATLPTQAVPFMEMLTSVFGERYPYVSTPGALDQRQLDLFRGFFARWMTRASSLYCEGRWKRVTVCKYRGLVLFGVGQDLVLAPEDDRKTQADRAYLRQSLEAYRTWPWKVCYWNRPAFDFQLGAKKKKRGRDRSLAHVHWYELCRVQGAIVVTGHAEHVYARTHSLTTLKKDIVAEESVEPMKTDTGMDKVVVGKERTFVVVSGLVGGKRKNLRDELLRNPWWAAIASKQTTKSRGCLFCTFHYAKSTHKALCEFRDLRGITHDRFEVESLVEPLPVLSTEDATRKDSSVAESYIRQGKKAAKDARRSVKGAIQSVFRKHQFDLDRKYVNGTTGTSCLAPFEQQLGLSLGASEEQQRKEPAPVALYKHDKTGTISWPVALEQVYCEPVNVKRCKRHGILGMFRSCGLVAEDLYSFQVDIITRAYRLAAFDLKSKRIRRITLQITGGPLPPQPVDDPRSHVVWWNPWTWLNVEPTVDIDIHRFQPMPRVPPHLRPFSPAPPIAPSQKKNYKAPRITRSEMRVKSWTIPREMVQHAEDKVVWTSPDLRSVVRRCFQRKDSLCSIVLETHSDGGALLHSAFTRSARIPARLIVEFDR